MMKLVAAEAVLSYIYRHMLVSLAPRETTWHYRVHSWQKKFLSPAYKLIRRLLWQKFVQNISTYTSVYTVLSVYGKLSHKCCTN